METYTFRLDADLLEELREEADRFDRSLAEHLRTIIRERDVDERPLEDRVERLEAEVFGPNTREHDERTQSSTVEHNKRTQPSTSEDDTEHGPNTDEYDDVAAALDEADLDSRVRDALDGIELNDGASPARLTEVAPELVEWVRSRGGRFSKSDATAANNTDLSDRVWWERFARPIVMELADAGLVEYRSGYHDYRWVGEW